jgi:hypothetical protein
MAPSYFEGYGLRVPLTRVGQKRLHARSASELTSKCKKDLFNIAKDITNGQASKLKFPSRSELALYIEKVETLALGPHPNTTLPCKFTIVVSDRRTNSTSATKKEDLIEALGLKKAAQRAKCNKVKKDAPQREPASKKASPPPQNKVFSQSILPPSARDKKSEQRSTPVQQATPPASPPWGQTAPKPVSVQSQILLHAPLESAKVAQKSNKRKYDSEDPAQTPLKKTRVTSIPSVNAPRTFRMSTTVVTKALVVDAPTTPLVSAEQADQDRADAPTPPLPTPVAALSRPAREKQKDLDVSPKEERDSFSAIEDLGGDTVVAPAETTDKRAACFTSKPHNTLELPITHTCHAQGDLLCLSDPSSDEQASKTEPEQPFLKPGIHGRGGDFEHDPDRATGRGHQVDPRDLARRRVYDARYWTSKNQVLFFPWLDREPRHRAFENVEGLKQLRRDELWIRAYREKYPGEVVGHLWDCGCEMVGDGEESEEE